MADPAGKTSSSLRHTAEVPDKAVLDLEHLDHHTFNDNDLRNELLTMFAAQIVEQQALLAACSDHGDWLVATHTMKGSARAVGAWKICEVAENLEGLPQDTWLEDKSRELAMLGEAVKECLAVIKMLTT